MNRKIGLFILFGAVILAALAMVYQPNQAQAAEWMAKVDPWVMETAAAQPQTEFLVFLTTQADVSGAAALQTKEEKGQYMYEQLTAVAQQTQPAIIAALDTLGAEYKPFWVANMIWVRGDMSAVQAMALRPDIAHIYANPTITLDLLPPEEQPSQQELIEAAMTVEWNIALVNAPAVWTAGYTGQGVVIGGQDTGYDWDHPALINQYRGWNGSTADHNYNWHDSIHSGSGGICGLNSPLPCDDNGHGTHTMGTMVGDDGGTNQIGMAPGAKWIGCRNMDQGDGTPATYTECYQWFIAPTDLNDQNPNPNLAPHVINNSWSCPPSEGCSPNSLLTVVQNVRAAGIVTVHSAGNSGSACNTVDTPSAIYAESFSVGSTTIADVISGFSSRGVVTVDGSNRRKPDISAPGSNIRSSVPGTGYANLSGTSMAGPHVAGLIGLILSAAPDLAGNVDALEDLVEQTAVPKTTNQGCGGDGPTDVPNNVYGYGRIDALAAYNSLPTELALALSKTVSAETAAPGQLLTYTLTVTNTHPVATTTGVVLTDTIPAGTTFVTATLPHMFDGSMVTWQAAALAPSTAWTVGLEVEIDLNATGSVVNDDYSVYSDDAATTSGEPVTTAVVPHELQVGKTGPTAVAVGDLVTYTLAVTNSHPFATQHDLVLTDTIPDNTAFVTATLPHATNGDTVQWTRATLNAGESWTVTLVVQVNISTTSQFVENSAYGVSSNEVTGVTGPAVITIVGQPASATLYLPFVTHPNQPPNLPGSPSPAHGASNQPTTPTLSWAAADPDGHALTFDLYLAASNPPGQVVASDLPIPSHTLTAALTGGITYYWRVVAKDEPGATTIGPVWSFTTTSTFAQSVVNLVNQERATEGCAPLAVSQQLTVAALAHSTDMALNDFFSHTGSNGSSPWERINNAGYNFSFAGENIAAGYTTPQAVMTGWMNSPGHRANILNCNYQDIGVGHYHLANDTGTTNYHHYWTQVFARPSS